MPLTITTEPGEGIVTIRPAGSLDSNTYHFLEEHIAAVAKRKPRVLIFDLKDLHYISSAGVRVILATRQAMRATGTEVVLAHLQPQIRKVFGVIRALPSLTVFESIAELDRYLTEIQKNVLGKEEE
ncbi:MAG TPA: STAS domain-containing protein [Methylomirabilota bacterium]|jgi:anti-sigma B factor antagonist|nr:STAS domain-containing protein [Methylomirabilota bacterium]